MTKFFVIDGNTDETVFEANKAKAEAAADRMNLANHKARGKFGAGRYYVTDVCDADA